MLIPPLVRASNQRLTIASLFRDLLIANDKMYHELISKFGNNNTLKINVNNYF